ncbi:MAG: hypothetical protein GTO40_21805, partial [Deltaproteobacteria bacterium]|nr:hypothetical protein [Deltaproteobacteria bacterium]
KNRLVYIEYGPRAARRYFETVRSNLRILYDGKLPHAELKTDADAKPLRVENWYETHPEGPDIGYSRSRTYYDL